MEAVGVSAGRHRDELDRRILHRRIAARIYLLNTEDSSGSKQLQSFRRGLRAAVCWRVCADRLLGRIVLVVSQENFPANLKEEPQSLFARAGEEIKNKTDTTLPPAIDHIGLLVESGPKTHKVDRQVLCVVNEHLSLQHD